MRIRLTDFTGLRPMLAPEQLPENGALIAENCKLASGAIVPVKATAAVNAVIKSGTRSLYRHKGEWLSWDYDTDVAKCPVARDAFGRIYFTTPLGSPQGGKAQMLNYYTDIIGTRNEAFLGGMLDVTGAPYGSYHLGMPAPATAPTLGTPVGGDATQPEAVAYVYTYVSMFGEESPPSPATLIQSRNIGATVQVSWTAPGSDYVDRSPVLYANIYRTNTGSDSTEYQFVSQRAVGDGTWSDTVPNSSLVEVLASLDWDPPVTGIMGLCNLPNGSIAGFKDNTLYFSEPNRPHAYPLAYIISFAYDIVAIANAGMSLLIVTTGPSFVVTGNTPGAMTYEQMEMSFSCISKRSIVDIGTEVIYASPLGLVSFSAGGSTVLTNEHLRKEDWTAFIPSTITAFQYSGSYIAFYDNGSTVKGGVMFSSEGNMTTLSSAFEAEAGWYDQADGELYLVIGGIVYQYDVGPTTLTYTWKSKVFFLPAYINFGAAQVIADAYPVTFRLHDYSSGSDVVKFTKTVADSKPFRLPAGFRMQKLAAEVLGDKRITSVSLAQSIAEMGRS